MLNSTTDINIVHTMAHFITYKGIEHERMGDAPFIGALIIAQKCSQLCPGCFNQHIKQDPNLFGTAESILDKVQSNAFNEGIILGGLEWTEQPEDLVDLVRLALWRGLKIMIYTRLTEEEFFEKFPMMSEWSPIYYKFGPYLEEHKHPYYFSKGIQLASTNQRVVYKEKPYDHVK